MPEFPAMKFVFGLDPNKTIRALIVIVFLLAAASLIGQYSTYFLGDGHLQGFVPEFNLDREMNIPTWFSSILFLFSALLLWKTGDSAIDHRRYWRGLAFVFVLLSLDEVAALHEMAVDPFRKWLHAGGLFYFSWVIPGAVIVAVLSVLYLRVFLGLPPGVKRIFLLAAALFLGGALGLEMAGGRFVEAHGAANFTYALLANAEESLEMLGQVVFLHGLFLLLKTEEIAQRNT